MAWFWLSDFPSPKIGLPGSSTLNLGLRLPSCAWDHGSSVQILSVIGSVAHMHELRVSIDEAREDARLSALFAGALFFEIGDGEIRVGAKQEFGVLDFVF